MDPNIVFNAVQYIRFGSPKKEGDEDNAEEVAASATFDGLLRAQPAFLKSDNELKRLFGSEVVSKHSLIFGFRPL